MSYGIDILNSIRNEGSQEYQNRIPEATQLNIQSIGNALQTYTVLHNEFCEALFNKIGKTILEKKLFQNKLARFKQGKVLNQQDVEEIFVEMARAESSYDPEGKNPLGRRNPPDVKAIYHRQNRQDVYAISIGDIDFVRVFRSEATLESFVKAQIESIYSGASYDEWLAMKNLIATYDGYFSVECPVIGERNGEMCIDTGIAQVNGNHYLESPDGINSFERILRYQAKSFLKAVRKVVQDVSFASTKFNAAGVMTWSDPSQMVLLINKDLLTEIDVEVLSKAFNIGKTDIQVEIIAMDDFGDNSEETLAIMVDKDWFRVYDTLSHFEPQRNAHGLFTNYFYHVHQILSASRFKNAIRFYGVRDLND